MALNALDVIIEAHSTIESAQAGDSGAMWGHLIIATGALIGVGSGLLGMAGVAAWAGPLGWVSALVMATGAFILAKYSANDLQMFAMHCFLGNEYGGKTYAKLRDQEDEDPEESGKPWMVEVDHWDGESRNLSWAELRYQKTSRTKEADNRFELQRTALLRLLCDFSTSIVPVSPDHRFASIYIYPGLVPEGAIFQVEAQLKSPVGEVETYQARIWPGQQTSEWSGASGSVSFTGNGMGSKKKWINVTLPSKAQSGVDIQFRSRLLLDPAAKLTIPPTDWYVEHQHA